MGNIIWVITVIDSLGGRSFCEREWISNALIFTCRKYSFFHILKKLKEVANTFSFYFYFTVLHMPCPVYTAVSDKQPMLFLWWYCSQGNKNTCYINAEYSLLNNEFLLLEKDWDFTEGFFFFSVCIKIPSKRAYSVCVFISVCIYLKVVIGCSWGNWPENCSRKRSIKISVLD